MNANQTFISFKEIREFYKRKCENENLQFSEEKFKQFVQYCERDFHQWLVDNLNCFFKERTIGEHQEKR